MRFKLTAIVIVGVLFSASAAAQAPKPPAASSVNTMCGECGVVRSVRAITKESALPASDDSKPSGLVVSVPLGGGKASVGGSQNIGKDAVAVNTTWEVVVRLDDGRFRVMMVDEEPAELREGDKVRIEQGKPVRRQ